MTIRIGLFSDLHSEFRPNDIGHILQGLKEEALAANVHVLVNAGDTSPRRDINDVCHAFFGNGMPWKYVHIHGNHDFYRSNDPVPLELMNQTETFEISGTKFFAGTLWTNFWNNPITEMESARAIADFKVIPGFTTEKCRMYNESQVAQIKVYDPDVLLTHFSPTTLSINPRFTGDSLNGYFCNNMDTWLINDSRVRLVLHGHDHGHHDYNLAHMRVVANPLGYPKESVGEYHLKIIDIGIEGYI